MPEATPPTSSPTTGKMPNKTTTSQVVRGVDAALLSKLPKKPLTAEQQAQAIRQAKEQAQMRVTLGKQLLQAANTRLTQQHDALQAIRTEQTGLRDQLQQDVAQSLQQYDQWLGQADERFSQRFDAIEARMTQAEAAIAESARDIKLLLAKADQLLPTPGSRSPTPSQPTQAQAPEAHQSDAGSGFKPDSRSEPASKPASSSSDTLDAIIQGLQDAR